jgi:hypothetical protein
MKATPLLTALLLATTALVILPSAEAMQTPPPCMSVGGCCGIEPGFAPCCSPISCPPPVAPCPDYDVDTSPLTPYRAPFAGVETDPDCSANACIDSQDCSDAACAAGDHACCSIDGTGSFCTDAQPTDLCSPVLAPTAMALPLPHVSYAIHPDCTVTVYETYDCPDGFWDSTVHYDAGPADVWADSCGPMCACMPLELQAASDMACMSFDGETPVADYAFSNSCRLTVSQAPSGCQAWHYESTSVGPATLRLAHCDGGPEGS